MIDELRALADTLSKATPGRWWHNGVGHVGPAEQIGLSVSPVANVRYDEECWANSVAICASRNSEDLLRQAADELERLKAENLRLRVFVSVIASYKGSPNSMANILGETATEFLAELEARP